MQGALAVRLFQQDKGRQRRHAPVLPNRQHGGAGNVRQPDEVIFHVLQLDPEAVELDLSVQTAEIIEHAVFHAAQIARVIAACAVLRAEKQSLVQLGAAKIAGADGFAEHQKLACLAVRQRAALFIGNDRAHIFKGPADGQRRGRVQHGLRNFGARHKDGRLRWAVGVDNRHARKSSHQLRRQLLCQHLAAEQKLPHLRQQLRAELLGMDAELRQRRRRHPCVRPCLAQKGKQRLRAFERLPVRCPERHAAAERLVQCADRDVEGIGNFIEKRAALRQPREPRLHARVERG